MNFFEAMRALENGKMVISEYSNWKYKVKDGVICGTDSDEEDWSKNNIMMQELAGEWAIYEEQPASPQESRNFMWALSKLKEGKKVRRGHKSYYYKASSNGNVIAYCMVFGEPLFHLELNLRLLDEDNWELVE